MSSRFAYVASWKEFMRTGRYNWLRDEDMSSYWDVEYAVEESRFPPVLLVRCVADSSVRTELWESLKAHLMGLVHTNATTDTIPDDYKYDSTPLSAATEVDVWAGEEIKKLCDENQTHKVALKLKALEGIQCAIVQGIKISQFFQLFADRFPVWLVNASIRQLTEARFARMADLEFLYRTLSLNVHMNADKVRSQFVAALVLKPGDGGIGLYVTVAECIADHFEARVLAWRIAEHGCADSTPMASLNRALAAHVKSIPVKSEDVKRMIDAELDVFFLCYLVWERMNRTDIHLSVVVDVSDLKSGACDALIERLKQTTVCTVTTKSEERDTVRFVVNTDDLELRSRSFGELLLVLCAWMGVSNFQWGIWSDFVRMHNNVLLSALSVDDIVMRPLDGDRPILELFLAMRLPSVYLLQGIAVMKGFGIDDVTDFYKFAKNVAAGAPEDPAANDTHSITDFVLQIGGADYTVTFDVGFSVRTPTGGSPELNWNVTNCTFSPRMVQFNTADDTVVNTLTQIVTYLFNRINTYLDDDHKVMVALFAEISPIERIKLLQTRAARSGNVPLPPNGFPGTTPSGIQAKTLWRLRVDGLELAAMPDYVRDDLLFVRVAIWSNGMAFEYASERLRANVPLSNIAMNEDVRAFRFHIATNTGAASIPNPFAVPEFESTARINCYADWMRRVERSPLDLETAPVEIRNNIAVVRAAMKSNVFVIAFATDEVRRAINGPDDAPPPDDAATESKIVRLVQKNGMHLGGVHSTYAHKFNVVRAAVNQNGMALQFVIPTKRPLLHKLREKFPNNMVLLKTLLDAQFISMPVGVSTYTETVESTTRDYGAYYPMLKDKNADQLKSILPANLVAGKLRAAIVAAVAEYHKTDIDHGLSSLFTPVQVQTLVVAAIEQTLDAVQFIPRVHYEELKGQPSSVISTEVDAFVKTIKSEHKTFADIPTEHECWLKQHVFVRRCMLEDPFIFHSYLKTTAFKENAINQQYMAELYLLYYELYDPSTFKGGTRLCEDTWRDELWELPDSALFELVQVKQLLWGGSDAYFNNRRMDFIYDNAIADAIKQDKLVLWHPPSRENIETNTCTLKLQIHRGSSRNYYTILPENTKYGVGTSLEKIVRTHLILHRLRADFPKYYDTQVKRDSLRSRLLSLAESTAQPVEGTVSRAYENVRFQMTTSVVSYIKTAEAGVDKWYREHVHSMPVSSELTFWGLILGAGVPLNTFNTFESVKNAISVHSDLTFTVYVNVIDDPPRISYKSDDIEYLFTDLTLPLSSNSTVIFGHEIDWKTSNGERIQGIFLMTTAREKLEEYVSAWLLTKNQTIGAVEFQCNGNVYVRQFGEDASQRWAGDTFQVFPKWRGSRPVLQHVGTDSNEAVEAILMEVSHAFEPPANIHFIKYWGLANTTFNDLLSSINHARIGRGDYGCIEGGINNLNGNCYVAAAYQLVRRTKMYEMFADNVRGSIDAAADAEEFDPMNKQCILPSSDLRQAYSNYRSTPLAGPKGSGTTIVLLQAMVDVTEGLRIALTTPDIAKLLTGHMLVQTPTDIDRLIDDVVKDYGKARFDAEWAGCQFLFRDDPLANAYTDRPRESLCYLHNFITYLQTTGNKCVGGCIRTRNPAWGHAIAFSMCDGEPIFYNWGKTMRGNDILGVIDKQWAVDYYAERNKHTFKEFTANLSGLNKVTFWHWIEILHDYANRATASGVRIYKNLLRVDAAITNRSIAELIAGTYQILESLAMMVMGQERRTPPLTDMGGIFAELKQFLIKKLKIAADEPDVDFLLERKGGKVSYDQNDDWHFTVYQNMLVVFQECKDAKADMGDDGWYKTPASDASDIVENWIGLSVADVTTGTVSFMTKLIKTLSPTLNHIWTPKYTEVMEWFYGSGEQMVDTRIRGVFLLWEPKTAQAVPPHNYLTMFDNGREPTTFTAQNWNKLIEEADILDEGRAFLAGHLRTVNDVYLNLFPHDLWTVAKDFLDAVLRFYEAPGLSRDEKLASLWSFERWDIADPCKSLAKKISEYKDRLYGKQNWDDDRKAYVELIYSIAIQVINYDESAGPPKSPSLLNESSDEDY